MDAFGVQSCKAAVFAEQSAVYIHCCEVYYEVSFTVATLQCLRLNAVFLRISFLESPSVRRMCVIPRSEFDSRETCWPKLALYCPCEILCSGKVGSHIAITPATSTDVEEYPQAPLLDLNAESLHCNCSKFPNADKIMIVSEDDSPRHLTPDSAEPEEASFERDINNTGLQPDHHESDDASDEWFRNESEGNAWLGVVN
ncbi:Hypothetical predicted protein [Paramuricea clavata]|uniref:Uncharacterized protein n=1 Tax=Paramuricea clavata TaxID=317549 RepID=A0A6S7JJT6_PARCT|nr:Hypothetical predicted protein [Paramuricea clavata]